MCALDPDQGNGYTCFIADIHPLTGDVKLFAHKGSPLWLWQLLREGRAPEVHTASCASPRARTASSRTRAVGCTKGAAMHMPRLQTRPPDEELHLLFSFDA